MERKVEDKIVRQIEKSLSNNINDNLFSAGRMYDKDNSGFGRTGYSQAENKSNQSGLPQQASGASYDYYPESAISREEYVRQAREACLRQLSSMQRSTQRAYDMMYYDEPVQNTELTNRKKARALHLFHDSSAATRGVKESEDPRELASFRFLVFRMIFAIIIFLSVFLIDKFDFEVGGFTPQIIQEYVTGNDTLQELENLVMTWLK